VELFPPVHPKGSSGGRAKRLWQNTNKTYSALFGDTTITFGPRPFDA
jgi:hypothetical protein